MDQRPDERARCGRVADGQSPEGGHDAVHHLVGHRFVDDEPAQAGAALAGGAGGGEHHGAHREVQVGRRGHDGGVVAAQLQQHPAEPRGDAGPTSRPIRTEPVADTSATRGRRPAARRGRGRRAPGSSPRAGRRRRPRRGRSAPAASAVNGVSSEGFHTTGSPHTRASAAFHAHTATGKLNAVITPTTPSGCQVSSSRCPGRSDAMVRPYSWRDRPTANWQTSIISCTSPAASG